MSAFIRLDAAVGKVFFAVLRFIMRLTGASKYQVIYGTLLGGLGLSLSIGFITGRFAGFVLFDFALAVYLACILHSEIKKMDREPTGKGLPVRSKFRSSQTFLFRLLLGQLFIEFLVLTLVKSEDIYLAHSLYIGSILAVFYFVLYDGGAEKSWAKSLAEKFSRNYATQR